MNKKQYALIVFDWYGTLYNSVGYISHNLKSAVQDLDWPMFNEAEYVEISGLSMNRIIDALYPERSPEEREQLKTRARFHSLVSHNDAMLYPGVREVLAILKNNHYFLGLATSKGFKGVVRDLEQLKLSKWFDAVRTADKTFPKPHPLMLEQIMEQLTVSPQATLMVGDSGVDIQMALNAGVDAIGINTDLKQRKLLAEQGAKTVITILHELLFYLGIKI